MRFLAATCIAYFVLVCQCNAGDFDVATGKGKINFTLPAGATVELVEVASYKGQSPITLNGVTFTSTATGCSQVKRGLNYTASGGSITFTGYSGTVTTDIAAPMWSTLKDWTGSNYMITVFVGGKVIGIIYTVRY